MKAKDENCSAAEKIIDFMCKQEIEKCEAEIFRLEAELGIERSYKQNEKHP